MISKKEEHIVCSGQWLGSKKPGNSRNLASNFADSKQDSELNHKLPALTTLGAIFVLFVFCLGPCELLVPYVLIYKMFSSRKEFLKNSIVAIPNIPGNSEHSWKVRDITDLRISGLTTQWRSPEKNTWHLTASALAVNGENIFRQNGGSASLVK